MKPTKHIDEQENKIKNLTRTNSNYYAEIVRLEKARAESDANKLEEIAKLQDQIETLKTTTRKLAAQAWYNMEYTKVKEEVDKQLEKECKKINWEE